MEVLCVWGEDKRLITATKSTPLNTFVKIIKVWFFHAVNDTQDEYGTFPIQIKYKNEVWGEFITISKDSGTPLGCLVANLGRSICTLFSKPKSHSCVWRVASSKTREGAD
jgi:hypothetical protein